MASKDGSVNLFPRLSTLDTVKVSAEKLIVAFKEDKRYPESFLQKFINVNRRSFDFLGISPFIEQIDYRYNLVLTTSKNIGTAPIYSPRHKPFCDIVVTGRYNEEVGELIPLLGDYISPEYSDELKLTRSSQQTPPIYLECCRFIDKYVEAKRFKWQKFSIVVQTQKSPNSGTDWNRYALDVASDPLSFGTFCNRRNVLTTEHIEWRKLNYVLLIAIDILSSHTTPIRARTQYRELVGTLSRIIDKSEAIPTEELIIHASEPRIIKELKAIGNLILQGHVNQSIAWRMDYAEFFERFVQYLFTSVARRKGCLSFGNEHFSISGKSKPRWGLAYLEPDLVLQKDGVQYIIDAKYKSHIFNWSDTSDDLKVTFRQDLHQVIAYSSFSQTPHRNAMLVYPYNVFFHRVVDVRSPLDPTTVSVSLVGIPIGKKPLNDTVDNLASIISF